MSVILASQACEKVENLDGPQENPFDSITVVEGNVAPGDTIEYKFLPVQDWQASVPTSTYSWFWLDVNGRKDYKCTGKAGKDTVCVRIVVSAVEELTQNRYCELSLSMGDETNVVARYCRPAAGLNLSIRPAKVENGTFVNNADSTGYVYSSEPVEEISLIWSEDSSKFIMPVLLTSNLEWSVSLPDYLKLEGSESTKGEKKMMFVGKSLRAQRAEAIFYHDGAPFDTLVVNVPAPEPLTLYSAIYEDGEILYEDGGYVYTSEPVSAIELFWSGTDYRLPVKVYSKSEWTMALPEWIDAAALEEELPQSKLGYVEFVIKGNPSKYPLETTEDKIVFLNDGEPWAEIQVVIPGSKDKMSYNVGMSLTELEYSYDGLIKVSTGFEQMDATIEFTATSGARIFSAVMENGSYVVKDDSWLRLEVENPDNSSTAAVIQTRVVTVRPDVNEAEERKGLIFLLPESVTAGYDELFTSDNAVKEEYASYCIPVIQYTQDMDYVTLSSTEDERLAAGCEFAVSKNPRLDGWFGESKYKYALTYHNVFAQDAAYMNFSKPFKSYKIFNAARKDVTKTSQKDSLMWFTPASSENKSGVLSMYLNNEKNAPLEPATWYLVFFDVPEDQVVLKTTSPLAIVECKWVPEEVVIPKFETAFVGESVELAKQAGATLTLLTDKDSLLFEKVKYVYGTDELPKKIISEYRRAAVYHLNYVSDATELYLSVPLDADMYSRNPSHLSSCFMINNYTEAAGKFGATEAGVKIRMKFPDPVAEEEENTNDGLSEEDKQKLEIQKKFIVGKLFFYSNETPVLIIVCTLDTEGYLDYLYQ